MGYKDVTDRTKSQYTTIEFPTHPYSKLTDRPDFPTGYLSLLFVSKGEVKPPIDRCGFVS